MSTLSTLSAPTVTALAAALAKEAKSRRADLTEDSCYVLDDEVTLKLSGELPVGRNEEYTPTTSIPTKIAFALFVRYSGVTGQAALDALEKAMTEAIAVNKLTGKAKKTAIAAISEAGDLDAAETKVLNTLDALPAKTRKGKVLTKDVAVEVVD